MERDIIYSPAWWIPGGHLQTLWGKLFRRQTSASTVLERWDTPDGDFLEVHRLAAEHGAPRVLLLHGLEGTIRSHYAQALLNEAARRGWGAALMIFLTSSRLQPLFQFPLILNAHRGGSIADSRGSISDSF